MIRIPTKQPGFVAQLLMVMAVSKFCEWNAQKWPDDLRLLSWHHFTLTFGKFPAFIATFHGVQTYHVYLSLYISIYTYKKTYIPLPSLPHLAPPPHLHRCWQGWEGTLQSLNPQQLLDPATAPPPSPPAPPVAKAAQRPRSPYLTARHRRPRSAVTAPKVRRVDDDGGGMVLFSSNHQRIYSIHWNL